jgi:ERCC4-type nuclease
MIMNKIKIVKKEPLSDPKYTLKLDCRESKLIEFFEKKSFKNIDLDSGDLSVGDIQIIKNGKIVLVIERKTLQDHVHSIKDKRYHNQKIRLKTMDCPVVYLIEGHPILPVVYADISRLIKNVNGLSSNDIKVKLDHILDGFYPDLEKLQIDGMSLDILHSSWIGTMLRDQMYILRSISFKETCLLVKKMYLKLIEFDQKNELGSNENIQTEYLKTVKLQKKDNIKPDNCLTLLLAQIPSVSVTMGESIRLL